MNQPDPLPKKYRVAILDDHHLVRAGYRDILGREEDMEVVGLLTYGEEVKPFVAATPHLDVLILDVKVPVSKVDSTIYPIFNVVASVLDLNPDLNILVISSYLERTMVRSLNEAGVKGYVTKGDEEMMAALADGVRRVAGGKTFFCAAADKAIKDAMPNPVDTLTRRQVELISLQASRPGWGMKQLAEPMGIAVNTVRSMFTEIYAKLGVTCKADAIVKARQLGLLLPDDDINSIVQTPPLH